MNKVAPLEGCWCSDQMHYGIPRSDTNWSHWSQLIIHFTVYWSTKPPCSQTSVEFISKMSQNFLLLYSVHVYRWSFNTDHRRDCGVPLSWVRLRRTPITALMQSSTALPTLLKLQWGSAAPDSETELLFKALLYRWIISSQCRKALVKWGGKTHVRGGKPGLHQVFFLSVPDGWWTMKMSWHNVIIVRGVLIMGSVSLCSCVNNDFHVVFGSHLAEETMSWESL